MPDPRETLARIRKQADAATEGPWCRERSHGAPSRWQDACVFDANGEYVISEARDEDAKFIAASRATVPALAGALEKVLAMHTPKNNGRVSMCCSCEQWIESPDNEACIEYPCPTVTAITQALEGEANE